MSLLTYENIYLIDKNNQNKEKSTDELINSEKKSEFEEKLQEYSISDDYGKPVTFTNETYNKFKLSTIKNVLIDDELRQGIKEFSDWPTIPQLYIKKEFVGGCDIVKEMYENGELKKVLEDKGINFKK